MSDIITPEWQKPVVRVPLNQAFPQMGELREFKNKVCLFSADRSRLYDVVSPRYQLVEHGAGLQTLDAAMQKRFGKSAPSANVRTFNGGARMLAEYRLPVPAVKIAKGDISEVLIRVRNSYDRTCSFSANLAALRLVCTNGMTTTDNWGGIRLKHISGEDEQRKEQVDAYIAEQLDLMITSSTKLADKWTEWADRKITLEEATSMIDGVFPEMYTAPILDEERWKHERSFWKFYNDLTYMSSHQTKSPARRQQFDDIIANLFYGKGAPVDLEDAEEMED